MGSFLSKPGVSKKIISVLLIGFIVLAVFAFVMFAENSNPAQLAREQKVEQEKEKIRQGTDSNPDEAREKLSRMEVELREARERERSAIEARMNDAKTGVSKEDEARRVADNLKITLPRSPSAMNEAGIGMPSPNAKSDMAAERLMTTHQSTDPAAGAIGSFEAYGSAVDGAADQSGNAGANSNSAAAQNNSADESSRPAVVKKAPQMKIENAPAIKPITPNRLPTKNYMLGQGSVIRTVFVTGVNTQHPGDVIVRVTEDVYDTVLGTNLLIPKGARLIGRVGEVSAINEDRHPVTFDRLVMNDGRSIKLPKMPAITRTGETGVDGDYHSNMLPSIMPALIAGMFGVAMDYLVSKKTADNTTNNNYYAGSTNSAQPGQTVARQVFPDVQKRLSERYAGIKPYFTIDPGTPFLLMVNADFAIPPNDEPVLVER